MTRPSPPSPDDTDHSQSGRADGATDDLTNGGRSAFYCCIRCGSGRKILMIAYTAWDSLRAIAQQYDADLVLAPGERLGLPRRRDQSVPGATLRRLGKRLRAGLAARQVPTARRS